jgi:hypothetical protein
MSVMWEYLSLKFNLEQETRGSKKRAFLWLLVQNWFKTLFRAGPKTHVQRLDGMTGMSWNSAPSCGFVTKSSHGPVASGPTPQQRGNTKSSLADPPLLCLCLALVLNSCPQISKGTDRNWTCQKNRWIPTSKTNQHIFDDLVGSIEISPTPRHSPIISCVLLVLLPKSAQNQVVPGPCLKLPMESIPQDRASEEFWRLRFIGSSLFAQCFF